MSIDDSSISGAKTLLRKAIQVRRAGRAETQRADDDQLRTQVLRNALRSATPRRVASYLSTAGEPGTQEITTWLAGLGVAQIMPVVSTADGQRRDEVAWSRYEGPDRVRVGWRSIAEPTGPTLPADAVRAAEVVLCPGLAGAANGARLGRGGGWYDRALITVQAPIWLLLNDDEVLDDVPQHGWDRPVDALVTPTRFIACAG